MILNKFNESYGYISNADIDALKEVYKALSFYAPGYRFTPRYKAGYWDGQIHLLSNTDYTFPLGLTPFVSEICKVKKHECIIAPNLSDCFKENINEKDIQEYLNGIKTYSKGNRIYPREDQYRATIRAITSKRCINICPTSFGKSLSITLQCLYYINRGMKCLIVVPTKDLVNQFANDIKDYATDENGNLEKWYPFVQSIYSGQDKKLDKNTNICISTWQSLIKIAKDMDEEYMNQFDAIILDECHRGQANSIRTLMLSATNVAIRTGWTGSLSEEQISELLITGLFGPKEVITTTKELMDKEIVAQLSIEILRLRYSDKLSKMYKDTDYETQVNFIETCEERNKLLLSVAGTQAKTGLIFYKHIEHGEVLFNLARQMFPERNIFFVHGGYFRQNDTKYKTFEDIKPLIEKDNSAIILANYQIASTGISIKNLHWMMFFVPIKSFISTLQSIGRVLRISATKKKAILFDIVDDLSVVGKRGGITPNYALKHFSERFNIYNLNNFEYRISRHNMPI